MLSKKAAARAVGLCGWHELGDWGLASPDRGVGLDAQATNATYTDATQLTHTRVWAVVG